MKFMSYLALDCNSTYDIMSVDYNSGKISVTVDYTEDMEERYCSFSLTYDPIIVDRPASQL